MNLWPAAANAAWAASNLAAWSSFRTAIENPSEAQNHLLRSILRCNAETAFGRAHGFDRIDGRHDFAARVPVRTYEEFEPWIDRVRRGEQRVLTSGRVTRLATTGGSSGAVKLIPYTADLQADFGRAIGPWIVDLFRSDPSIMAGPAYWSISAVVSTCDIKSTVPIGFEDDGEYLGGLRRRLVDRVMAVPASVRHAASMQQWRDLTVHHLARCRDLRLISVWHPSFLTLLLDQLPAPPAELWPHLKAVSCWTDGHAGAAARLLADRLPGVAVQPKGLIATEGIVSIPFAGGWPLAVRSHFFEFIADSGAVLPADELEAGQTYEVLLTTSGGLYRYRLGDLVRIEGFVARTPSIRFVGRAGVVSDWFGEKLTEAFVGRVVRELSDSSGVNWPFSMLAMDGRGYTLFLKGAAPAGLAGKLDRALQANPQYAYCRDLGQLQRPRIFCVTSDPAEDFAARLARTQRLGDIKPAAVSRLDGWSECFRGTYSPHPN
jgi:hypothetical protein